MLERGVNDPSKSTPIRDLVRGHKAEFVSLIETRLQDTSYPKIASFWGNISF